MPENARLGEMIEIEGRESEIGHACLPQNGEYQD
jgi:hypothetical protein